MADKCEILVNHARLAAARLDALFEAKSANDVRALCHSNAAYRAALRAMHRENRQLRDALSEQGNNR